MRNVDIMLTEDDIKSQIISPIEILEVKRMNRKNPSATSDDNKWLPTTSV